MQAWSGISKQKSNANITFRKYISFQTSTWNSMHLIPSFRCFDANLKKSYKHGIKGGFIRTALFNCLWNGWLGSHFKTFYFYDTWNVEHFSASQWAGRTYGNKTINEDNVKYVRNGKHLTSLDKYHIFLISEWNLHMNFTNIDYKTWHL
jgi:hypothetical protein